LSENDVHLIDLLFEAHIEKGQALRMEIVDFDEAGEGVQRKYGFFVEVHRQSQIEGGLVTEYTRTSSPFKTWLIYKGDRILKEAAREVPYLKEVYD